jgi:hypothetical protein
MVFCLNVLQEFNRVDNILPEGFPNWKETLDHWSDHLLRTTKVIDLLLIQFYATNVNEQQRVS